jgi:hypothetical protein
LAIRNPTTGTEVDTGGFLTESSTRITVTAMTSQTDTYLYWDDGADHYDALDTDYELYIQNEEANKYGCAGIALTNTLNDVTGFGNDDISVLGTTRGSNVLWIRLQRGNFTETDYDALSTDTLYYGTLSRSAGSGTVVNHVYSDSARTTEVATQTITGLTAATKWRYQMGTVNYNTGTANRLSTGYIQNIDNNEVVNTTSTPTYAQLVITTYTPSYVLSDNIISTPTYAQLVITTYTPSTKIGYVSTPTYAQLQITTYTPQSIFPEPSPVTKNPGTMADDASVGTIAWVNPDNAKVSNNTYTIALFNGGTYSHRLKATNFGFTIPVGASINGILVSIEKYCPTPGGDTTVRDRYLNIIKADGSIGTTNNAKTTSMWPTSDSYISYGSSTDLWGETWTSADINDADFGVAFAVSDPAMVFQANVDHIRITVYYSYDVVSTPTYSQLQITTYTPQDINSSDNKISTPTYAQLQITTYTTQSQLSLMSTPTYAQLQITTYTTQSQLGLMSTPTYAQLVITTYTPSYTVSHYDYLYYLLTGFHKFFSKAYRDSLVLPNYISVTSLADDTPQYSGYAIEPISNAIYDNRQYEEVTLASNAQGTAIATALMNKYKMASDYGFLEVPMNVGQEMFDFIEVIDTREGDTREGNAGYIRRIYNNMGDTPEYSMTLGFGNWFQAGEDITELNPGGLGNAGQGNFEKLYAKDGYIENLTAGNILLYTMDDIDEGTNYKRVLSTQLSEGKIYLSNANTFSAGYDPSGKRRVFVSTPTTPYDVGDLFMDDTNVKRCTTARASGAYVAGDFTATTMDAIGTGETYGRVLAVDIDGETGQIILSSNIKVTGDWYNESGVFLSATHGIGLYGGQVSFRTYDTFAHMEAWGATGLQVYIGTDGKLYAGGGVVKLDADGINITSSSSSTKLSFTYSATTTYLRFDGTQFIMPVALKVYGLRPDGDGNGTVGTSELRFHAMYAETYQADALVHSYGSITADANITATGVVVGGTGVLIPNYLYSVEEEGSLCWWGGELDCYQSGSWRTFYADI